MLDYIQRIMSESRMFREALEAIEKNQRARARDLLTRLLRMDKENPDYWLWLSSVVESDKERVFCLKSVLRIDPNNQSARRGLRLMGETVDDGEVEPVPPKKRLWEIDFGDEEKTSKRIIANPMLRLLVYGGGWIVVIGLVLVGIFAPRGTLFGPRLTITPIPWSATPSGTPTDTPVFVAATATPEITSTPQPLWMLLDATYTPRPLYVNTPHPRSEAYQIAMRALERGDYESALNFMEQVQRENPEAADPYYYIGEAHRFRADYDLALQAYENAIALDPEFAPAHLGRGLAQQAQDDGYNVESDLKKAIALAPDFGEAYLALASYQLESGDPEGALTTLRGVADQMLDHPRFYMLRAQIHLSLGQNEDALNDALKAHELDITALPVYMVLGEALIKNDLSEEALNYIQTYGSYRHDEPLYWTMLGAAQYMIGEDYQEAMNSLDQALALDEEFGLAYQYRGLIALEIDEPKKAVNDLYLARTLLPDSFDLSLGLARAFWADGNVNDAYIQVNASEVLARSDRDFGRLYYYRAQIAHELSQYDREKLDWKALLELPEGAVPEIWRNEANQSLNPPTDTPTATSTFTYTITLTPTLTPTLTKTPSPTPTRTQSPSVTP